MRWILKTLVLITKVGVCYFCVLLFLPWKFYPCIKTEFLSYFQCYWRSSGGIEMPLKKRVVL